MANNQIEIPSKTNMHYYICVDNQNTCGLGNTLQEAWEDYQDNWGHEDFDACSFYNGQYIEVKQTIIEVKQVQEK